MLVGSDDGVYHIREDGDARKTLDSGRVMRLRQFDDHRGVFAATRTGLFWSPDGEGWTDLGVPREKVYAVGASDATLYAGTRPAAVYVADMDDVGSETDPEWRERQGFQELPSREQWRLPRHENLAQVRDVHSLPGSAGGVVAGVEVGGVHRSDDAGQTWTERREGVDDDVHELHVVGPEEYVAATGHGLFRSDDAGRSWARLDGDVEQRYFRRAYSVAGTVYAAGALSNSTTWNDDDADPALFVCREDGLEAVDLPAAAASDTVTGMTDLDGDLVVATHRGRLLAKRSGGWERLGQFPVPGEVGGRYTPVTANSE